MGGIAAQKSSGDLSHPRRPLRGGSLIVLVSLLASLLLRPASAFEGKPKFGPNAVPILAQTAYLRTAAAPDYWKLNPAEERGKMGLKRRGRYPAPSVNDFEITRFSPV